MGYAANGEVAGEPGHTIGERLRTWPPPAVAATVSVAGSVALTVVLVAIGLVITSSSLSSRIAGWDGSLERWVQLHRTATLNSGTDLGSSLGGTGTILLVAGIYVGLSRVYRGMHHPTDVLASVVLGLGAISFALLAVRATAMVADRRRPRRVVAPRPRERSEART